jgi:hypothetical protein
MRIRTLTLAPFFIAATCINLAQAQSYGSGGVRFESKGVAPRAESSLLRLFHGQFSLLETCLSPLERGYRGILPLETVLIIGASETSTRYCSLASVADQAKYLQLCQREISSNKGKCIVAMTATSVNEGELNQLYQFTAALENITKPSSSPISKSFENNSIGTAVIDINLARNKCKELGLKEKTEAYGKCVLELSK